MSYNLTITLNHINDENYDADLSANVAAGQFIAVTSNKIAEGASTREMTVQIFEASGLPGGTVHTNSGLYVRQPGETEVKATLLDTGGNEVDSTTASYS